MTFTMRTVGQPTFLTSPLLDRCGGVAHGFSTRLGGVSVPPWDSLNLGVGRGDDMDHVLENYRRFCGAIGVDAGRTVLSRQVHEDHVLIASEKDAGKGLFRERDYLTDAIITNVPGLALTVFSADCGTVLLYDPVTRCVGAVHAGWRGVANGVLRKTALEMGRVYGAKPEDLRAAFGPSIGQCCFETDDDVPQAMRAAFGNEAEPFFQRRGPKWHVDLKGLNARWLLDLGVPSGQVDICDLCTACRTDLFWSYRKVGNVRGAQAAMIALN
ncbi:peptidoglycan editing factor PgeF [Oscillibacter hominis]|uniref:Purine nucleoside phosphorylase n=1 Tax=Oscillibacter hominis TaxID=2763056 RepID=A0A7G9B5C7_9FIRM|nr:peptidoglycan editing factor PgeF [Oscillibacter hominis]QNL44758.1 peptidoglycan editing factor PgeF [Oscillibacter hominis]